MGQTLSGRRFGVITLALSVIFAGFATTASGQDGGFDGSAFDQYLESVPGRGGDTPSNSAYGSPGEPLPPEAAGALGRLGEAGRRTAAVAARITPTGERSRDTASNEKGGLGATIDELLDPNGEGLGFVLPLLLLGTLIAGVAFALRRHLEGSGTAR